MGQVKELKHKLHSTHLSKNFPREDRQNADLCPSNLDEELKGFIPPEINDCVYAVVKRKPSDDFELIHEFDLQETLPYFNSILLYRIFKLLYGPPDILATYINTDSGEFKIIPGAVDWGYLIKITDLLHAEVASARANTRVKLRFWAENIPKDPDIFKFHMEKGKRFHFDFIDCVEKNAHLFNENQEITEQNKSWSALLNIFAERYSSAERLFDLAAHFDKLPPRKDLKWNESLDVSTGGSIYLSSAISYVMALESLINTIYHLLLKTEFRVESYERITKRGDLDLRIVTAHLFCDGFSKQILSPKTELWNKLLKLRSFRNEMVHGNITANHYAYALQEDAIIFFYNGVTDFRGRKTEEKAKNSFPTTLSQIDKTVVVEIKNIVDEIVQAFIEAADAKYKKWFHSWVWEASIPRFE